MRPADFRSWCEILWGGGDRDWALRAAAVLQVSDRNVNYWAAGRKPIPPGVVGELGAVIAQRLASSTDQTPGLAPLRAAQMIDRGTAAA